MTKIRRIQKNDTANDWDVIVPLICVERNIIMIRNIEFLIILYIIQIVLIFSILGDVYFLLGEFKILILNGIRKRGEYEQAYI